MHWLTAYFVQVVMAMAAMDEMPADRYRNDMGMPVPDVASPHAVPMVNARANAMMFRSVDS